MKRQWQICRTTVTTTDAQQRWDQAYQLLLRCAMPRPPGTSIVPAPAPHSAQEGGHARSDLCPRLDQPSGAAADD